MTRPFIRVAVLEFGAYLGATALGINFTMAVLLGTAVVQPVQSLLVFYPIVIVAICAGAWLEVDWLRERMQDAAFPGSVNMEELRTKALEMMKREWTGRHNAPPPADP
jgi:hypothetical protein